MVFPFLSVSFQAMFMVMSYISSFSWWDYWRNLKALCMRRELQLLYSPSDTLKNVLLKWPRLESLTVTFLSYPIYQDHSASRRREIEGPRRAHGAEIFATAIFTKCSLLQYIPCGPSNACGAEMQNEFALKLHPALISGSFSMSRDPSFKSGPGVDEPVSGSFLSNSSLKAMSCG